MYLIEIDYTSDAERKRIEYLASKWEGKVLRPSGYVIMVPDDIYPEVSQEISGKFPLQNIRIFSLEPENLEPKVTKLQVKFHFNRNTREVKSFISYLISRRRGLLTKTVGDMHIYNIHTRKGMVQVSLGIRGDETTEVILHFSGTPEATELIGKEFREEIEVFGGVS